MYSTLARPKDARRRPGVLEWTGHRLATPRSLTPKGIDICPGRHGGSALQPILSPDLIDCERIATVAELKANWEIN